MMARINHIHRLGQFRQFHVVLLKEMSRHYVFPSILVMVQPNLLVVHLLAAKYYFSHYPAIAAIVVLFRSLIMNSAGIKLFKIKP